MANNINLMPVNDFTNNSSHCSPDSRSLLKNHIALIYTLFFTLLAGNAFADTGVSLSYATGNKTYFSLDIPDDWKINVGFEADVTKMPAGEAPKPRLITLMPNDLSHLWFGLWVPNDVANIEAAKVYLKQFRGFFVDNPVTTKTVDSENNGIKMTSVIGTGERKGTKVDVAVAIFQLTPNNVGIAIYIGPPESTKRHKVELTAIMQSIRPAG